MPARRPDGPCVMCKGNESIEKGFDGASIVMHVLIGVSQCVQLEDLVELLCEYHRIRYEANRQRTSLARFG